MKPSEVNRPTIAFRLPLEQKKWLQREAKKRNKSIGDIILDALVNERDYLKGYREGISARRLRCPFCRRMIR